jgi:integrase
MKEKQQRKRKHRNGGLRKQCGCARRAWPKCAHRWHFNFKARGGHAYRFSLDKHFNRHIDSKSEAEELAADLRKQIRSGTFGQAAPLEGMTLRQLMDIYLERSVRVKRAAFERATRYQLDRIAGTALSSGAKFGDCRVADIVTDTVEQFRAARYADGTGPTGTNRYLGQLRPVFNWALLAGYVDRTPFVRAGKAVVKFADEVPRTRRLQDGEAERLLSACGPHLRAVVECAPETGMRSGEITSLQWSQVEGMRLDDATPPTISWAPQAAIFLPSLKTKTKRDRRIPISTRLRSILELRRLDPAGKPHTSDKFVFGNAVGEHVESRGRAWYSAILKAHGHEPTYTKGANLDSESRAALKTIDCTSTTCGARRAAGGWMRACRWRQSSGGSATTTSARRAPTSLAPRPATTRRCACSSSAGTFATGLQRMPDHRGSARHKRPLSRTEMPARPQVATDRLSTRAGLGAECRWFKSSRPDHFHQGLFRRHR